MELLVLISFIVGILTVLAPCTISLLPVILGGSISNTSKYRPYIIIISLGFSIFIFSFLLQIFSSFISISEEVRRILSGGIIILIGIFTIFPDFWGSIFQKLKITQKSDEALSKSGSRTDFIGAVLTGAALGPVLTTCSPTFGYVLTSVVGNNNDIVFGGINIIAYILGLCLILLLISIFGQLLIQRIKGLANPGGWFKKFLGFLFIIIGIFIVFKIDKKIQIALIQNEAFENFDVSKIDQKLLDNLLKNNE